MAEIRQDLKLQSDPSTIVRPNIIGDCIPDRAITKDKIAYLTITSAELADDAATEDKIMDGAVTAIKIAPNAVQTSKIGSGAVTNDKLASSAVTTGKIADSQITSAKLLVYTDQLATYLNDDEITTETDFETWIANLIVGGCYWAYLVTGTHIYPVVFVKGAGVTISYNDGTEWVNILVEDDTDYENFLAGDALNIILKRF